MIPSLELWLSVGLPFHRTATASTGQSVLFVTSARVKWGSGRAFLRRTLKMVEQMNAVPGLLGFAVRRSVLSGRVWTLTFWDSEAALRNFVTGEAHREAVREFTHAVVDMKTYQDSTCTRNLPQTQTEVWALLNSFG